MSKLFFILFHSSTFPLGLLLKPRVLYPPFRTSYQRKWLHGYYVCMEMGHVISEMWAIISLGRTGYPFRIRRGPSCIGCQSESNVSVHPQNFLCKQLVKMYMYLSSNFILISKEFQSLCCTKWLPILFLLHFLSKPEGGGVAHWNGPPSITLWQLLTEETQPSLFEIGSQLSENS